jgi:putative transposase
MISSVERAPVHANAKLVVDGTDQTIVRKAEFAFKPSAKMERQLLALLGACCEAYDAGLEERRRAWAHPSQTSIRPRFARLRRLADRGAEARTLTVTRRPAGTGWAWRACVGVRNVLAVKFPARQGDGSVVGCDRGAVVTVATSNGDLLAMPPFMVAARDEIAELQRQRATKRKGSRAWRQLNRRIAKAHRKARQQTDHWARETAKDLVDRYDVSAFEHLRLRNMTRSAKGTKENPGKNVAAKQALNRRLMDAGLGTVVSRTCAKAEEAGRIVWLVDPKRTSQTCAACGHWHPADRRTRDLFVCRRCGHTAHADTNAAENIAARGRTAQVTWQQAGAPPLTRRTPRLRRRTDDTDAAVSTQAEAA